MLSACNSMPIYIHFLLSFLNSFVLALTREIGPLFVFISVRFLDDEGEKVKVVKLKVLWMSFIRRGMKSCVVGSCFDYYDE